MCYLAFILLRSCRQSRILVDVSYDAVLGVSLSLAVLRRVVYE
jgi:hypothetical protein